MLHFFKRCDYCGVNYSIFLTGKKTTFFSKIKAEYGIWSLLIIKQKIEIGYNTLVLGFSNCKISLDFHNRFLCQIYLDSRYCSMISQAEGW